MSAQVLARRRRGVVVVTLAGDLDHANVFEVERDVRAHAGSADAVVLELDGVTWFDSAGVAMLDRLLSVLARRGAAVRVVAGAGTRARAVLRIVAFDERVLAGDLNGALAAVSGSVR